MLWYSYTKHKSRDFQRRKQFLEKKLEETTNLPEPLEENNTSDNTEEDRLVEQVEPGPVPFKCDQCNKTFKTKKGLKVHVGRSHKLEDEPDQFRHVWIFHFPFHLAMRCLMIRCLKNW